MTRHDRGLSSHPAGADGALMGFCTPPSSGDSRRSSHEEPMTYVPHTDRERADMLAAIGVARMQDLFADVDEKFRFPQLDLPPPAAEPELAREMRALAARNAAVDPSRSFLGAGVYHHFRPSTVDYVLSRG